MRIAADSVLGVRSGRCRGFWIVRVARRRGIPRRSCLFGGRRVRTKSDRRISRVSTFVRGRLRSGKVNVGLLVTLAVLLLIAGGYWTYALMSKPKVVLNADVPEQEYLLVCDGCKARTTLTLSQLKATPRDPSGLYECPKCKKPKAAFYRPGGTALPPGGG